MGRLLRKQVTGGQNHGRLDRGADETLATFQDDAFLGREHHRRNVTLAARQGIAPRGFHMAGFQIGQGQAQAVA